MTELKEALGGFGVRVFEGPVARFESLRASSIHEAILVTDGDITEEITDDLKNPELLIPITIDIRTSKAPSGKDDEAIIRAREIFDDVFPAIHGLEVENLQLYDIEGGRIEAEEITDGHYQVRFNIHSQEYYGSCR
jgi:hypothetical protein